MQTPTLKTQLAACLALSAALGTACGSAPSNDFFSPSEPANAGVGAGEGPSAAGASSNGGAAGTAATLEPSLPAAGAATAGAAAAGASGGSASTSPDMPRAMKSLVDDMEAMVSSIPESDGRAGYWYTFNDGLGGMQVPAPNGPFLPDAASDGFPGSAHARRSRGAAFPSYAGFGFDLNNRSGQRLVYDASAYEGVVLWVRGNVVLRVMFPTRATAPTNQGGACTSLCNDSFGVELPLTEQWRQQTVSFAALRQRVPSDTVFEPNALLGVAFAVPPGSQFDVWVDEIGFF